MSVCVLVIEASEHIVRRDFFFVVSHLQCTANDFVCRWMRRLAVLVFLMPLSAGISSQCEEKSLAPELDSKGHRR